MKGRKVLVWILLSGIPACLWFTTLRPTSLGGPAGYVMVRGVSMLPTYVGGDLIITRKAPRYAKGDIIAYRVPKGEFGAGITVIHRIIGTSAKGLVIRGDNNGFPDDWHPKPADIIGKAWIRAPKLGIVLAFMHSPLPLASVAAALVIVFVLFPQDEKKKKRGVVKPSVPLPVAQALVRAEQASDDDALHLAPSVADLERIPVLAKVACVVHRELEIDRLERTDRPAERVPLRRVA